ncbi:MAG: hypothetical protein FJX77_02175 [Armatimonadetes bacterium]|nr:hypothetical protein [Armatimonadota bacterium]
MVGWIALLGVLALMIAGIVWATMKSMETMELRARARTASQARMSADRLFQQRRFREAIQAYGRLAAGSQTERPAALRMAAWSAGEAVQSEMGAAVIPRQRDLPSRQQEWRELCARALQWNRNSPSVHLALARVAASARQFDAAADTLQQTESLAVRQRNAGDPNQRSEAEGVYRSIVAWRAAFKYEEASGLVARFPQKARSRLEEVRNLVPNTAFAKQAETILKRLAETYRGATQDPEPGSAGSDSSSGSLGAPGFAPPYNGSPYPNQGQFPSQPQPGVAPGGPGGGAGRYSPGLDGPMVPPAGWDPNIRLSPGLPGIR